MGGQRSNMEASQGRQWVIRGVIGRKARVGRGYQESNKEVGQGRQWSAIGVIRRKARVGNGWSGEY